MSIFIFGVSNFFKNISLLSKEMAPIWICILINMCMHIKLWVHNATDKRLKGCTLLSAETVIRGEK